MVVTAPTQGQVLGFVSGSWTPTQTLLQPRAGGSTPGTSLNANTIENVNYAEDFNFSQSPASPSSISAGSVTVTINAVAGLNCWSAAPGCVGFYTKHHLWLAGTGTAEDVLLTATTCTGASTGTCTVTFTAAHSHSAGYTLASGTAGYQEAWDDCQLNTRNYQIADGLSTQSGCTVLGRPNDLVTFNTPFSLDTFQGTVGPAMLDGQGTTIACNTSGRDCITVGTGQGSNTLYSEPNSTTIQGFQFLPATGFVRTANGTSIVIHDQGQKTHIQNVSFGKNSTYVFDTLVKVDADQSFEYGPQNSLNTGNGPPMKCDSSWCGSAILGSAINNAALGHIHDSDFTIQCSGNPIDWQGGNGLSIENNVFQNWNQWAWRYGAGLVDITDQGRNYYEGGSCTNPDFGVTGYDGGIVYAGNHILNEEVFSPGFPPSPTSFSSTGTNVYMYYIVGVKGGKQSNPLFIGNSASNGTTHYNVLYKPFNADTYDVLRVGPTVGDGTDSAPYGTGNWAVSTGNVCSSSPCTFAETFGSLSSYTVNPAYVPANADIPYWPVPVFISNSANSAGDLWIGQCIPSVNTSLFTSGNFYNAIFTGAGTSGGNTCGTNSNFQTGTRALFLNPSQSANVTNGTTGAMMLNPVLSGSPLVGFKGRLNLSGTYTSSHDSCLETTYDSNVAKTFATWGHQPTFDTGDNCVGFSTGPTWTAWMSQSGYEWYVNHKFDSGASAKMQLTASAFNVNVNSTVNGNLTVTGTCTGCGGGAGNVSNSGTPTVGQIGIWVTATTIQGVSLLPNTAGGTGLSTSASTGVAQVSSGTWSVSTALANGTTATTQSAADNSTKVATTAYSDTSTALKLNIANSAPTGLFDASATTQLKLPVHATFATLANGEIGFDSTNKNAHIWQNAADYIIFGGLASGSFVNGDCAQISLASSFLSIIDAGGACGTSSMVYPSGSGIPIVVTGTSWGTTLTETDGNMLAGVSGAWTKVTALPNGITATTQAAASADTKVATDAYVDNHFIFQGTQALPTTAIASGTCGAVTTTTATGALTTDVVTVSFNGNPTAIVGFIPSTNGELNIKVWPIANGIQEVQCNDTLASITPGALTLNLKVTR